MARGTRSGGERALPSKHRGRSALIALGTAAVALAAMGLRAPPIPVPTCSFRLVTGRPCPACGLTRAFIALGHGRLREALAENLMSPLLAAALALALALACIDAVTGRASLARVWARSKRVLVPATLVLCLLAWTWNIYKSAVAG